MKLQECSPTATLDLSCKVGVRNLSIIPVQESSLIFCHPRPPQDGGMVAPSGIAIEKLGDINDDMVVVCASVTVGK